MPEAVSELIRTSLLIVGALFPIVNSPENVPILLALTIGLNVESRGCGPQDCRERILSSSVVRSDRNPHPRLLRHFLACGPGGRRLRDHCSRLETADQARRRGKEAPSAVSKQPNEAYLTRRAFYPLTLPLTVGPGSISVAIAVGASRTSMTGAAWILPAAAVLGCAFIAVTIYLAYRYAEPIGRVLGETAMNVIVRLSSFILLCIGVQILWNGVSALVTTMFPNRH